MIFDGNEVQSIMIFPSDLLVQGILERTYKGNTNISRKKLYTASGQKFPDDLDFMK